MNIIGKKMNKQATSIGWFCAWLKEQYQNKFVFLDHRNDAKIKMFKTDKNGKNIGYFHGSDVKNILYNEWIHYNQFMAYYNEIKDIGPDAFLKIVDDEWKNMMSVVTIEDDGLRIRKFGNELSKESKENLCALFAILFIPTFYILLIYSLVKLG